MKTINIKNKIKTFYNKMGELIGFSGKVKVYNKFIYVNTKNGSGYNEVIKELDKYINRLAYKYNLSNLGFDFDDTKQHIVVHILEGIPKYNPNKNMALSTFLHMRVERRIINELRDIGVDSQNPTVLRTSLYSVVCNCGRQFMIGISNDDKIVDSLCYGCNKTIKNAKIFSVNTPPYTLNLRSSFESKLLDETNDNDIISNDSFYIPMVYGEKPKLEQSTIFKHDFKKWIETEDSRVKKLIELVCFKDYLFKDAAKEIGISHTWAYLILKRLKRKNIVKNIFGR